MKIRPIYAGIGEDYPYGDVEIWECPKCGDGVEFYKNCSCGQEIDWKDIC